MMILSEYHIDGINNSTVVLQQRNHNAVMKLKACFSHYSGYFASDHAQMFDSGRIVDVGPAIELHFDFDGYDTTAVLYGEIDKVAAWLKKTICLLREE